jgi:di/tricarboxylate transporter
MTLSLATIQGALVSAVLVALFAVIQYFLNLGDIFAVDWKTLLNLGVLTALGSLVKNVLTNSEGLIGGVIKVK